MIREELAESHDEGESPATISELIEHRSEAARLVVFASRPAIEGVESGAQCITGNFNTFERN